MWQQPERRPVEKGRIAFLHRPAASEPNGGEFGNVQRLLIHLSPAGARYQRVIAAGRRRVGHARSRQRFWGFVDLVLDPFDIRAALGAQIYRTDSRTTRQLPATQLLASGSYSLEREGNQTHLRWQVEPRHATGGRERPPELELETEADYVISVANPDPAVWGLDRKADLQEQLFDELEVHVTIPAAFPDSLRHRFEGRRLAPLDTTEWLDHPGSELVFTAATQPDRITLKRASGE